MILPRISLIIPVFNSEAYLDANLKTVLKQDYPNLEILYINDGSDDKSDFILKSIGSKKITVYNKKNGGLSDARNFGLERASGDFICFADSDDLLNEEYVSYLYYLLQKFKSEIAVCGNYFQKKSKLTKNTNFFIEQRLSVENALQKMLVGNEIMISAWGKLYKRDLFNGITYPVNRLHEDVSVTYKIFLKCKSIAFGSIPRYTYVLHEGSIISKQCKKREKDLLEFTDEMCNQVCIKFPYLKQAAKKRQFIARLSLLKQDPYNKNLIAFCKTNLFIFLFMRCTSIKEKIFACVLLAFPRVFLFINK